MPSNLKHIGLIARREYLQRVRTKAFLITTIAVPVMTGAFTFAPVYFASQQFGGQKSLVVVSDSARVAKAFQAKLQSQSAPGAEKEKSANKPEADARYKVTIDSKPTPEERAELDTQLFANSLTGYVWLTQAALQQGTAEFHTVNATDLMTRQDITEALDFIAIQDRLEARGVNNMDVAGLLKPVRLETVKAGQGKASEDSTYLFAVLLVLAMYLPMVMQVVAVMRSVIEEKTSRVMEVMLSAVSPKELMAGKIIGVGGVGLTQVLIWSVAGVALAISGILASGTFQSIHFPPQLWIYFILFYLLGYLLYSALAAALGASVSTEEDAQQLQFFVMLPLIASMVMLGLVLSAPSSTAAVVLSLVPFFAPILMYLRIVVEQPPLWQLALCIGIMVATIYGVLSVCARIYRVGILMYGKRPTLPEILKWIRYA